MPVLRDILTGFSQFGVSEIHRQYCEAGGVVDCKSTVPEKTSILNIVDLT
jgi:hypothetical protein